MVDAVRKLVSERLRRQAPGEHPEAEALAAFAENVLLPSERRAVLDHLAACSACRGTIFLVLPSAAEMQKVMAPARRSPRLALRWGTVAAAVVVAAIFVVNNDRENQPARFASAPSAAQTTPPATVAQNGAPAEFRAMPGSAKERAKTTVESGRAEPKHMTAKPSVTMSFEDSGQVQVSRNADVKEKAANAPIGGQAENALAPQSGVTAAGAKAETVEVNAEAPAATETADKAAALDKQQVLADALGSAGKKSPLASARTANMQSAAPAVFQWTVGDDGSLQRSVDGKSWQAVPLAAGAKLLAVNAIGADVWAGGSAGVLYHSSDSGLHWARVTPKVNGSQLQADIVRIEFANSQQGTITTSDGQVWATSNAGASWDRK